MEIVFYDWPTSLNEVLLRPSGLGDLSVGKCLMTSSISSVVKGSDKRPRSCDLWMSSSRLKCFNGELVAPSLSLKASHTIDAFVK
jgi:hypothetical protein